MGDEMSENKTNGTNIEFEVKLGYKATLALEDLNESIIFLFYNNNLVMFFDSKKKVWKFPHGQKGKHENSLECVVRETFEKTGAILEDVLPIGYFMVNKGENIIKTAIYLGRVERFETRPEWSEAELVKLFDELPQDVLEYKIYNRILNYIKSEH